MHVLGDIDALLVVFLQAQRGLVQEAFLSVQLARRAYFLRCVGGGIVDVSIELAQIGTTETKQVVVVVDSTSEHAVTAVRAVWRAETLAVDRCDLVVVAEERAENEWRLIAALLSYGGVEAQMMGIDMVTHVDRSRAVRGIHAYEDEEQKWVQKNHRYERLPIESMPSPKWCRSGRCYLLLLFLFR